MLFEQVNQLLKPGYLPIETGYYRLSDGQMHVAVLTSIPGCTGKMIDWWFGYFSDNDTYSMWHPKSHLSLKWDKRRRPGHYVGAGYIAEIRTGHGSRKFRIHFHESSEFFDTTLFESGNVKTAICANVYDFEKKPKGRMIHIVRDTDFGCEIRSRFWLFKAPEEEGCELMQHCFEKMGNLADFLPDLYEREVPDK